MSVGSSSPLFFRLYPIITQASDVPSLIESFFEIRFKPQFSISFHNLVLIQSNTLNIEYQTDYFGNSIKFSFKEPQQINSYKNIVIACNNSILCQLDSQFCFKLLINNENVKSIGFKIHHFDTQSFLITPQDLSPINQETFNSICNDNSGENWLKNAPKTNRYLTGSLWDYSWLLHQINTIPSFSPFQFPIIIPSRISEKGEIDLINYHSIHIIDDLVWYREDLAVEQLKNFFRLFRESDGMIANRAFLSLKQSSHDVNYDYTVSQPPVWSYILLELAKYMGNSEILVQYYQLCCKNILWWEKNRFFPEYGLFGTNLPAKQIAIEMTMPYSPRFFYQYNGKTWNSILPDQSREILLIDLNSQIADYYQNLGVIGSIIGDENAASYFQKAEQIQDRAQELLWDEKSKFYYDFDIETQTLQPIKTSAAFWSLFGGLVSKGKISEVCNHLLNSNEFGTELPYPAVSSDFQNFANKEVWSGTVCLSQHYWLLVGLKRYGMSNLVSKLIEKVFRYLNDSFVLYGSLYEYYPSMSYNVNSIKSSNDPKFRNRFDYLGHNVIHSLFYRGLLGGEILDESITFIPDWNVFNKDINYSFFYRMKKLEAYMSKMKNKMLEFTAE